MTSCPNCNYELVLLEHHRKYKCAKCGKLFSQREIEIVDFHDFNKRERKKDKEMIFGKPFKQPKLTEFEKRDRANNSFMKHYEINKIKILGQQRRYRLKSGQARNERLKVLYAKDIDDSRLKSRLKYWRAKQKVLALDFAENCRFKAYNHDFSSILPIFPLS